MNKSMYVTFLNEVNEVHGQMHPNVTILLAIDPLSLLVYFSVGHTLPIA